MQQNKNTETSVRMHVIIREIQNTDRAALLQLAEETGQNVEFLAKDLHDAVCNANFRPAFFVAIVDGTVVGCIALRDTGLDYGTYSGSWHMVKKEYRGQGIGKMLAERVLAAVRAIRLSHCIQIVTDKPGYYAKFGMVAIRITAEGATQMALNI